MRGGGWGEAGLDRKSTAAKAAAGSPAGLSPGLGAGSCNHSGSTCRAGL